jgi:hypothetical protein
MILDVLALLGERNSLRAIERLEQCPHNTSLHWLDLAGQHTAAVSREVIHGRHITQAQVDELWTFVKKSKRIANPLIRRSGGMPGFGEPSPYPVGCAWSAISAMNEVRLTPSRFWPNLRLARRDARPCSRVTNCPPRWPP